MRRLIAACVMVLLTVTLASAAAIPHTFVEQNTNQSTSSTSYVDISGASITSGNFTTGKKYLLFATAQIAEATSGLSGIRAVHGSTAFDDSESVDNLSNSSHRKPWSWFTVWTAVTSEAVTLQFKSTSGETVNVDQVFLLAIQLSDNLIESTDWCYNALVQNDSLTTTYADGASCTITPSSASNWLVLVHGRHDVTVANDNIKMRLSRSGEASSSEPEVTTNENTSLAFPTYGLARVFSLGTSSNTFKQQSASQASSNTRTHSAVFIVNMNKFSGSASAYSAGPTSLSTTQFATQMQTTTVTPTVTGNVWMGGMAVFDRNSSVDSDNGVRFRIQVDNADQPSSQTSDAYITANMAASETTDKNQMIIGTIANLNTSAHTVDFDGSSSQTGGQWREATVWAIPMELASGGGGGGGGSGSPCIIGGRADQDRIASPCGVGAR